MSTLSLRVDNKVILVTGGYGHLGRAITESLAFHGATVIVGAIDESKFKENYIAQDRVHFIEFDISDSNSISNAYKEILDRWRKLDAIVNNAFYLQGKAPENLTDEEWNIGAEGTLGSVYKCIREVIPHYKKQGYGKIINVSSMYGIIAPDFNIYTESPEFLNPPHYGAAKAGVLQLTRYFASYLGKDNILVNAVTPGAFPSKKVQEDKEFVKKLSEKTCLGRIGSPVDIAGAFVFLASDAANYITGQNIIVDGGWTAK